MIFLAVGFETWHLGLIAGIVVLISSSRFLLLKSWPDFADSSEAANRQVKTLLTTFLRFLKTSLIVSFGIHYLQILTSLEPLDYLVVAMLPGISEVGN